MRNRLLPTCGMPVADAATLTCSRLSPIAVTGHLGRDEEGGKMSGEAGQGRRLRRRLVPGAVFVATALAFNSQLEYGSGWDAVTVLTIGAVMFTLSAPLRERIREPAFCCGCILGLPIGLTINVLLDAMLLYLLSQLAGLADLVFTVTNDIELLLVVAISLVMSITRFVLLLPDTLSDSA